MIDNFKHYFNLAHMKQQQLWQGANITNEEIADDLVNNVPIYDVVHRKYAAFSSFPEALYHKRKDPKGNGQYFETNTIPHDENFASLLYLFRLCGSGINYKPKVGAEPWGTHGFGNFWVVESIKSGRYRRDRWLDDLPNSLFCDVKGYMLPMISGGMYNFIKDGHAYKLVDYIWERITYPEVQKYEIYEVVELGNKWLLEHGFKRQNFVLCAFAMDLAEYFPKLVSPDSRVLVGSNARKCLKLIFPTGRGIGSNLDATNEALQVLCDETGNINKKYDMEDVACDFIRYIENFQSPDHIKANNGIKYYNSLCS